MKETTSKLNHSKFCGGVDNQQTQSIYGIKVKIEPRLHWWKVIANTTLPTLLPILSFIHKIDAKRIN